MLFRGYGGETDKSDMWWAFTAPELGEMLPKTIRYSHEQVVADVFEGRGLWFYMVDAPDPETGRHTEIADTEADARAKSLIYLLEHHLLGLRG